MDSQLILFKVNTPIKKRRPLTHNWPDLGCSCLVWTMWGMCGWWVSHRTFMPICVLLWGSSFPACSGSLLGCLPTPVSLPTPVTLACQCRSRDSERKLRQWDFESSSLFCFPCTSACWGPNNYSYSYSVLAPTMCQTLCSILADTGMNKVCTVFVFMEFWVQKEIALIVNHCLSVVPWCILLSSPSLLL